MHSDPYKDLRAQEDEITKIISSLSIQEGLKNVLQYNEQMTIDVKKIVKVLESLLSDTMLYQNKKLKSKVLESKNGWIQIKYLLNLTEVGNTLMEVDFFKRIDQDLVVKFIGTQIDLYPCSLIVNKRLIRRKIPFVDKMSLVKPIYIEGYKEEQKMKSINQSLVSVTEIYKFKFKIGQCWGMVYAAKPEEIFKKCEARNKKMEIDGDSQESDDDEMERFRAVSYESMTRDYSAAGQWTDRFLGSGLLKPLIKAYLDSEIRSLDAKTFEEIKQKFDLSPQQGFRSPPKNLRQLLGAWDYQQRESYREQMEIDGFCQTKSKNQDIGSLLQIKKIIRQKRDQLIQNFLQFYQPNLEFNSKAFAEHQEAQNHQSNQLTKSSISMQKDESSIDRFLEEKFLSLNLQTNLKFN